MAAPFCDEIQNLNVPEMYEGRNLFITGASGFVGMAMLRKICLTLPKVNKLYLLLRPNKKCATARDRFEDLLANEIFQDIDKQELLESDKVVAMKGDLRQSCLGLSESHLNMLKNEFGEGVFIHCAADVKFDRPLNDAMLINVYGGSQCAKVAGLAGAIAFVHISTLYCNSCEPRDARVYEKIYPQGFNPCAVFEEWERNGRKFDDNRVRQLQSQLGLPHQNEWPNTYTLTKNICENVVSRKCEELDLSLSIVRLGIVSPTQKEQPGWFYGMGGFVFILIGVASGNLKFIRGDGQGRPDWVPVDFSVNAILAAGAKTVFNAIENRLSDGSDVSISPSYSDESPLEWSSSSLDRYDCSNNFNSYDEKERECRIRQENVYNIGLAADQSDDWCVYGAFSRQIPKFSQQNVPRAAAKPRFIYVQSDILFYVLYFLTYELPYYLLYPLQYASRRIARKVRWMGRGKQKLRMFYENYTFFVHGQWRFDNENMKTLYLSLDESSRQNFDFDRSTVDMESYALNTSILLMTRWDEHLKKKEEERKAFDKTKPHPLWNIVQVIFRLGVSLGGIGGISTAGIWVWVLVLGIAAAIFLCA